MYYTNIGIEFSEEFSGGAMGVLPPPPGSMKSIGGLVPNRS